MHASCAHGIMHTSRRVGRARVGCRVAARREGRRTTLVLGRRLGTPAAFPAAFSAAPSAPAAPAALAAALAGRCRISTSHVAFATVTRVVNWGRWSPLSDHVIIETRIRPCACVSICVLGDEGAHVCACVRLCLCVRACGFLQAEELVAPSAWGIPSR